MHVPAADRGRRADSAAAPALDLGAQAKALTDPSLGPLAPPVRSVLFGSERFAQHGRSLAQAQPIERRRRWHRRVRTPHFFPRIAANLRAIDRARDLLEQLDRRGETLDPAAEWLLDNFHLIEAQVPEVRNDLPRGYYDALPKLRAEPLQGLPRVYGIAWAFVAHTDSNFDAGLLEGFLKAYQDHDPLTLGELWAIPATLRVVLLENLARLAEGVAGRHVAQDLANRASDMENPPSPQALDRLNARLAGRGFARPFLEQLELRLRGAGDDAPPGLVQWLASAQGGLPDTPEANASGPQRQAADNVSVSNAVTALHAINDLDWQALVRRVSHVLATLERAESFALESELTRDQCTHAVELLARRLRLPEARVALAAVDLDARATAGAPSGPAHWLIGQGRSELVRHLGGSPAAVEGLALRLMRHLRGPLIAAALAASSLLALAWLFMPGAWPSGVGWLAVPMVALLGFEAGFAVLSRVLAELVPVRRLPRLALDEGLQPQHRTLVVVPCLLTSPATIAELASRLERHFLANPEAHTRLALLSDWADAPTPTRDGDAELLQAARSAIETLNRRHPAPDGEPARFALLHRERLWCKGEGVWMGWERKRGKLQQLAAFLSDEPPPPTPFVDLGPLSELRRDVRYIVTLDTETEMPPGTLRDLVAIAAHPLNQPRLDPRTKRVVQGFGILQPRIVSPLPHDTEVNLHGWLMSGPWGFDVYNNGASELYQDVFDQGSFSGKGLLDVQAMQQAMHGRIPEGRVLSHDLYEGVWARAAHLSDVALVEPVPMHPDVRASQLHRWTRGDWQLLPFLGAALRGRVGWLNVWKMLDNLRRTLTAPASLMLLWLSLSTAAVDPLKALALVAAALGLGPLMSALAGLLPPRRDLALRQFLREGARELVRAVGGTLWQLLTLPLAAAVQVDAIVRALWRMLVSRRGLLQWTTAAQAQAQSGLEVAGFWRRHVGLSLLALGLLAAAAAMPAPHWPGLLALCLLWALAPQWLWAGSQPIRRPVGRSELSGGDIDDLQTLARETWSLFERIVGPDDHHLPPDNLQLQPEAILAHRTSPTNIGLYLASCACAARMGFIGTDELLRRLGATLDTLEGLPRLHGHFFNWIDTRSLQMLAPRYVSTVDSGNFVALAWAVAQRCRELARRADATPQAGRPGARPEAGEAMPDRADIDPAQAVPLRQLATRLETLVRETDFRFLYDRRRRLFHIGLRVEDGMLDRSRYDLLASESRLGSFVAIAKGDVPLSHWQALGRPFLPVDGEPTLRSWSGSMFEYLMPALLMREPRGGLLWRVARAAVRAQRAFGRAQGVPWGVSECAYFEQDHSYAFQYGPFGVPLLALRRTPVEDLVIAPYATALALLVDAPAAVANLRALQAAGARGPHGFIESLDFSAPRRAPGEAVQRVETYMAHHQGMSLMALCNLLCDDAPRRWFEAVPSVAAHRSLLHERMPRCVVLQSRAIPRPPHRDDLAPGLGAPRVLDPVRERDAPGPTLLLGNGAYSVCLRPNGAGHSRWRGRSLSRSRDDWLRDEHGHWLLMQLGPDAAQRCSVTLAPLPGRGVERSTRFYPDHAEYDARGANWDATLSVWVSADDDVELRELSLHNHHHGPVEVTLTSVFEVAMVPQATDEAHPVFSNLFVHARHDGQGCLMLERRANREGEPSVWMAHFLADADGAGVADHARAAQADPSVAVQVAPCADRSRLVPRGGSPASWGDVQTAPHARHRVDGGDGGGTVETGLDPVAALTLRLWLPAGGRRRLTLGTAAAFDEATLRSVVDEYRQAAHLRRSALMSSTLARIRQRDLRLSVAEWRAVQDMTTAMTSSVSRPRRTPLAAVDRRALWRFGLSGERPLLLVRLLSTQGLRALRALLAALRLWDQLGLSVDLVLVNGEPASYLMPLQHRLHELRDSMGLGGEREPGRSAVHLLRGGDVSEAEFAALRAHARLELSADGRSLERLLGPAREAQGDAEASQESVPQPSSGPSPEPSATSPALHGTPAEPDYRFDEAGRWFRFEVSDQSLPARPWANVLANEGFGCILTERGGGFTWAGNSRLHQLTPWSNDPLRDPAGEHFVVRDLDSGRQLPLMPTAAPSTPCRVSHGAGVSLFEQDLDGLSLACAVRVDPREPAKAISLSLRNDGPRPRRLRVMAMVEWILGAQRRDRMTVLTEYVGEQQTVLARQLEHSGGFGDGTALLTLVGAWVREWSCARDGFFDRDGALAWPQRFDARHGHGLDPCGALAGEVELAPGAACEIAWIMGHAPGREAALALARRLRDPSWIASLAARVDAHWDGLLGQASVSTPDPLFDAMANRWLLYQTVVCRLWARAGFYQAGGATGFRDQLQDALALAWGQPAMLRKQILRHAARQFAEGDVQHWWHMPTGAGVRTRFSDDLLWLPYATRHYLECSGDRAILDQQVPFLQGGEIPPQAEDLYEVAATGGERADLYEHGARAIDRALRFGRHELPLMGGGDWNDGMNRVGREGLGESVWLGWFLLEVLRGWLPLARWRGDQVRLARWRQARASLRSALLDKAWDGQWFRRAYFDNGHPLGSASNDECRIDLIAQAWAVFALGGEHARAQQAMASADRLLVEPQHGLIRLLDPPLQHATDHAGYIQAYPPGVRENGGQYTHAAVWALMAQARLGHAGKTWDYFRMISPAHRCAESDGRRRRYAIEPYVLPGDTYSAPPYGGRGGWSWYSGSSAWLYRAIYESMLGLSLRRRGDELKLRLQPCLPPEWPAVELALELAGQSLRLRIDQHRAGPPPHWSGTCHTVRPGGWLRVPVKAGTTVRVWCDARREADAQPAAQEAA